MNKSRKQNKSRQKRIITRLKFYFKKIFFYHTNLLNFIKKLIKKMLKIFLKWIEKAHKSIYLIS